MEKTGSASADLSINVYRIVRVLALIAVGIVACGVTGQLLIYVFHIENTYGFASKFDLDGEANIPTFFSSAVLVLLATVTFIIARLESRSRWRLHWYGLAILFFYVAFDESVMLHEKLNGVVSAIIPVKGWFYFGWVIPGMIFTFVVAVSYWRFLRTLPSLVQRRTALAALCYIGGGLGFEMMGARIAEQEGMRNLPYAMTAAVEESLEITGMLLWLHTFVHYMFSMRDIVRIELSGAPRRPPAA